MVTGSQPVNSRMNYLNLLAITWTKFILMVLSRKQNSIITLEYNLLEPLKRSRPAESRSGPYMT